MTLDYQLSTWWSCIPIYFHARTHRIYLWIYTSIRDIHLMSPHTHTGLRIWWHREWHSRRAIVYRDDRARTCRRSILSQSEDRIIVCPLSYIYHISHTPRIGAYSGTSRASYLSSIIFHTDRTRRGSR